MSTSLGALEAVERILNRGGDADEVLRAVLDAVHQRSVPYAAIRFAEEGRLIEGPTVGAETDALTVPVHYGGDRVGELTLATDDVAFAERLATLISPYVLVGWDTGGEDWIP